MFQKIKSVIEIIEKVHNVKIIYACESGSRAWGFESKDSDWDIRFIYKRNLRKYLSVYPQEPLVLDRNYSKVVKDFTKYNLDFAGWDVQKALFQLSKGNPDLISWLHSPIKYRLANDGNKIIAVSKSLFKPISAYYHYSHMASRNYRQYIENVEGDLIKKKKYLYILRPLLNCMWIENFNSLPPMIFEEVYNNEHIKKRLIDGEIYDEIVALVRAKKAGDELDLCPRVSALDLLCKYYIENYKSMSSTFVEERENETDHNAIDNLFKEIILN